MVARSGEGLPQVVPSPFNERSLSGREVALEWKRPESALGVILNFSLIATFLQFGGKMPTAVAGA